MYLKRKKKIAGLLAIACFWLICHDGFRWEIGTDWEPYYEYFQTGENEHVADLGYACLNNLVHLVTSYYTVVLLLVAFITYSTLYRFFIRHSVNPLMSLCIYYCSMLGMMGSNRQILAVLICIMTLKYIYKRRLMPFLASVLIAMMFHKTAICFLPVYFLYNFKYKNTLAYCVIIGSFLVGISHLINHLPLVNYLAMLDSMMSGSTYSSYLDSVDGSTSLAGSFKRLLFAFIAIAVRRKIKSKSYDFLLLLYLIGCCIYLVFNGSVLQLLAGRGALYYSIFECITIPYVIKKFPFKGINKKLVWTVFFMMYFYLMWRDMNSYIISAGADIYNPYKLVFFQ